MFVGDHMIDSTSLLNTHLWPLGCRGSSFDRPSLESFQQLQDRDSAMNLACTSCIVHGDGFTLSVMVEVFFKC